MDTIKASEEDNHNHLTQDTSWKVTSHPIAQLVHHFTAVKYPNTSLDKQVTSNIYRKYKKKQMIKKRKFLNGKNPMLKKIKQ